MADAFEKNIKSFSAPILAKMFWALILFIAFDVWSDVKYLRRSEAQTDVKVENLEQRMGRVEGFVFGSKAFALKPEEIEIPKRKKH